jgi:hypothetical protein
VLNNQPQGGFATRRPTADAPVASDNVWGDDGTGPRLPLSIIGAHPPDGQVCQRQLAVAMVVCAWLLIFVLDCARNW